MLHYFSNVQSEHLLGKGDWLWLALTNCRFTISFHLLGTTLTTTLLQVILELKETNKDLLDGINGEKSIGRESVKSKISVSPPRVEDASPTLEADDSKTDVSLVEHTPVVKKTGRGRGKGRVNRR